MIPLFALAWLAGLPVARRRRLVLGGAFAATTVACCAPVTIFAVVVAGALALGVRRATVPVPIAVGVARALACLTRPAPYQNVVPEIPAKPRTPRDALWTSHEEEREGRGEQQRIRGCPVHLDPRTTAVAQRDRPAHVLARVRRQDERQRARHQQVHDRRQRGREQHGAVRVELPNTGRRFGRCRHEASAAPVARATSAALSTFMPGVSGSSLQTMTRSGAL